MIFLLTLVTFTGTITTSNMNKIAIIQASDKNVFSAQDLAVWWGYDDETRLYQLIQHYVRDKQIFTLSRGLYSLHDFTDEDLRSDVNLLYAVANKLVPNSYVSLWTGLKRGGVLFQYSDEIYSVANRGVVRTVKGISFVYKKIKDTVLLNDLGIQNVVQSRVAGVERAITDTLYLYPKTGLESLGMAKKELLYRVARIYDKKVMKKNIEKLWKEQYA